MAGNSVCFRIKFDAGNESALEGRMKGETSGSGLLVKLSPTLTKQGLL